MDKKTLGGCLKAALLSSVDDIEGIQQGRNDPATNCEVTFQRHLEKAFSSTGFKLANLDNGKRFSLDQWGSRSIRTDRQSGHMDLVMVGSGRHGDGEYAFELKVVGFPSTTGGEKPGHNTWQIGQDAMRLLLLRHGEHDERYVQGAWVIILGIGEHLAAAKTDNDVLRLMHNGLHCEFAESMQLADNGVGSFGNAREIGGCHYLGLNYAYYKDIRPAEDYFAVRVDENPRMGALAAWVGQS